MYTLTNFCFICSSSKKKLINLKNVEQVKYVLPELDISKLEIPVYICCTCQKLFLTFYEFKKTCLKNYLRLQNYIKMLKGTNYPQFQRFADLKISFNHNKLLKRNKVQVLDIDSNIKVEIIDLLSDDEIDIEDSFIISDAEELKTEDIEDSLSEAEEEGAIEDSFVLSETEEQEIEEPKTDEIEDLLPDKEEDSFVLSEFDDIDKLEETVISKPKNHDDIEKQLQSYEKPDTLQLSKEQEENGDHLLSVEQNLQAMFVSQDSAKEQFVTCEPDTVQNGGNETKSSNSNNKINSNTSHKIKAVLKQFKCSVCQKNLASKLLLIIHLKKHAGIKDVPCKLCDKKFLDNVHLKNHIAEIHQGIKNFKCAICNRRFAGHKTLKWHLRRHEKDNILLKCTVCQKNLRDAFSLNRHLKLHARKNYECSECQQKFKNILEFTEHKKVHLTDKNIVCTICNNNFLCHYSLKKHMEGHSDINKDQECSICNASFKTNCKLKSHMDMHNDNREFECIICNKKFKCLDNLRNHAKNIHGEEYKCTVCGKTFALQLSLEQHILTHFYDCTICGKKFKLKYESEQHMQTHLDIKNYGCKIYGTGFKYKTSIATKEQTKMHVDISEFQCSIVKKS